MENARSFRKFKKEPLILSLVLLTVSLAAFLFLYSQIENNQKVTNEAQASWQQEQDRREGTRSLERLIMETERERKEVDSHFAEGSNVVPLLDALEALALSVSAKLDINSVDIAKDGGGLLVDLKASGTFEAVYKYLLLLESSPYELEFMTVDLNKTGEGGAEWTGNFKLKLLSFVSEMIL